MVKLFIDVTTSLTAAVSGRRYPHS